jgi:hypothetical protein
VLAGLRVGDDAAAADRIERVELAVEILACGGDSGVSSAV